MDKIRSALIKYFLFFIVIFVAVFLSILSYNIFPFIQSDQATLFQGLSLILFQVFLSSMIISIVFSASIYSFVVIAATAGGRYLIFFIPAIISLIILIPINIFLKPDISDTIINAPADSKYLFPLRSFFDYNEDIRIYINGVDDNNFTGLIIIKNQTGNYYSRIGYRKLEDRILISPIINGEQATLDFVIDGSQGNSVDFLKEYRYLIEVIRGFLISFLIYDDILPFICYLSAVIVFISSFLSVFRFDYFPLLRIALSFLLLFSFIYIIFIWSEYHSLIIDTIFKNSIIGDYFVSITLFVIAGALEGFQFLIYHRGVKKA